MSVLSIEVAGVSVTIDSEVFKGYTAESYEILLKIEILKEEFKDLVETVSEDTKMPKADASAYLKSRFKDDTKKAKSKGTLFEALDNLVEG